MTQVAFATSNRRSIGINLIKRLLSAALWISLMLSSQLGLAQDRPDWIDNPGDGAVGSAPVHVLGTQAQEELAIARARIRLAARLGVVIDSVQKIEETVNNDQSSISSERKTTQEISQAKVRAQTRAIWHDLERDIIYAWVFPIE